MEVAGRVFAVHSITKEETAAPVNFGPVGCISRKVMFVAFSDGIVLASCPRVPFATLIAP